jgi:hypothetical protein
MMRKSSMRSQFLSYIIIFFILCCAGAPRVEAPRSEIEIQNEEFLKVNPNSKELFRVLFMSDIYMVSQMRSINSIKRSADPGGDKYMAGELRNLDKFKEVREAVFSVWLYPDTGRLMKVRPKNPVFLIEIDNLLIEDLQRWSFEFPRKVVEPLKFDVKYRIVLQKKQTDEEIMKELREKIKEKASIQ